MTNAAAIDDLITTSGAPADDLEQLRRADPVPTLASEALYGLPGGIVEAIDPYTEAAPVATLVHVLTASGNLIGPGPHARVQHDRHPVRVNVVLVGPTSKGRKGVAWSTPQYMLSRIDDVWASHVTVR